MAYFSTDKLSVGYNGHVLIEDIDIQLEKGTITTLIGPNGAGKSTILKSITRQLAPIGGKVVIDGKEISAWASKEFAKKAAVVLTDRIRPELMTCAEVVAMGRYPYTNLFGKLTEEDLQIVSDALERVHAMDLAQQDFSTLSDGQRQRILLARAICQQPEVIILDEPTAYLDIRHKVELLEILRKMAHEENITVIMSLHEIDLAAKVSDLLLCVKGSTIAAFGAPDEILRDKTVEHLYNMEAGSYNLLYGSVELAKAQGDPEVFVIGGAGTGIPCYRMLQKQGVPFAAGILMENDADYQVAKDLAVSVVSVPAFTPMGQAAFDAAWELLCRCKSVIDAGAPTGELNRMNALLLSKAKEAGIPVTQK